VSHQKNPKDPVRLSVTLSQAALDALASLKGETMADDFRREMLKFEDLKSGIEASFHSNDGQDDYLPVAPGHEPSEEELRKARMIARTYIHLVNRIRDQEVLSRNELHLGRILLLVMTPDQVIERLGDLEEMRSVLIAPRFGGRFSIFWFWWTGMRIALSAAVGGFGSTLSKIKSIWNAPSKG
jgi:hypothetical protein